MSRRLFKDRKILNFCAFCFLHWALSLCERFMSWNFGRRFQACVQKSSSINLNWASPTQVPTGPVYFGNCPEFDQWKAAFYQAGFTPHNPSDHLQCVGVWVWQLSSSGNLEPIEDKLVDRSWDVLWVHKDAKSGNSHDFWKLLIKLCLVWYSKHWVFKLWTSKHIVFVLMIANVIF